MEIYLIVRQLTLWSHFLNFIQERWMWLTEWKWMYMTSIYRKARISKEHKRWFKVKMMYPGLIDESTFGTNSGPKFHINIHLNTTRNHTNTWTDPVQSRTQQDIEAQCDQFSNRSYTLGLNLWYYWYKQGPLQRRR